LAEITARIDYTALLEPYAPEEEHRLVREADAVVLATFDRVEDKWWQELRDERTGEPGPSLPITTYRVTVRHVFTSKTAVPDVILVGGWGHRNGTMSPAAEPELERPYVVFLRHEVDSERIDYSIFAGPTGLYKVQGDRVIPPYSTLYPERSLDEFAEFVHTALERAES
jgi:hypothetical protein